MLSVYAKTQDQVKILTIPPIKQVDSEVRAICEVNVNLASVWLAEARQTYYSFFATQEFVKLVIVMKQDGSRDVRLMSCDHCRTKSCKQQQQKLVKLDMSLTKAIQPSNHSMHSTKNLSLLVLVMVVQIQNSSCCSWSVIFILVVWLGGPEALMQQPSPQHDTKISDVA